MKPLKHMLKHVLAGLLVAVPAFAASAPLLVVERWLGFVALAVLAALFFWLRHRFRFQGYVNAQILGFVAAFVLLLPAILFADLAERGLDDGPFYGRNYEGSLAHLKPSHRLKFRKGTLAIYNRDKKAPVVAYVIGDHTEWATEMYVAMTPGVTQSELHHMERPLLSEGLFRDRLDFIGHWTYGAEHGYAYIWKFGGIQRFYLSW